jgi:hypothetical protein
MQGRFASTEEVTAKVIKTPIGIKKLFPGILPVAL